VLLGIGQVRKDLVLGFIQELSDAWKAWAELVGDVEAAENLVIRDYAVCGMCHPPKRLP
jgi:hypothetical protein